MSSPPPPDPYAALGVPKDASATVIKSTYRKLVLKCHPDKVTDESLKAQKADEFHKIQQAYEILADEESRQRYDAQVRLAELRREALERRGSGARPAAYDDGAGPAQARTYEERRPSHVYDDDGWYGESRASARKYEGYDPASKRSSPRSTRTSDRAARSERRKTREKETRREREGKYAPTVEDDDSDEYARYEEGYRRRDEEARARDRQSGETRRYASRSTEDDIYNDREHKIISQYSHARDYIERAKIAEGDSRPHVGRSAHSQLYEVKRSSDSRPSVVRRSSARPKDVGHESSHHRSSGRERRTVPEIVEPASERRGSTSKSASSTPVEVSPPGRTSIRRAHTMNAADYDRQEAPAHPTMRRAESMPINADIPHAPTRRRESHTAPSSKLRHSESAMHDSGYSSPGTPEMAQGTSPPKQVASSVKYYYSSGGERTVPAAAAESGYEYANGHRTVVHEPQQRSRARTPSPTRERARDRTEMSSHSAPRPSASVSAAAASAAAAGGSRYTSTTYSYPPETSKASSPSRPPLTHAATSRPSPHIGRGERERKALFCEIPHPPAGPYRTEDVNWGKRYGPEDVMYASGYSRRPEREAHRPSMPRNTTYAY